MSDQDVIELFVVVETSSTSWPRGQRGGTPFLPRYGRADDVRVAIDVRAAIDEVWREGRKEGRREGWMEGWIEGRRDRVSKGGRGKD